MHPGDKLTIETPEQTVVEFPLAGIGSRFLALAIDSLQGTALVNLGVLRVLRSHRRADGTAPPTSGSTIVKRTIVGILTSAALAADVAGRSLMSGS